MVSTNYPTAIAVDNLDGISNDNEIKIDTDFEALMDKHYGYLHDVVDELDLWNWFATVDPPADTGYIFWKHGNMKKIRDALGDKMGFHSGSSWGFCLRKIQAEAKEINYSIV